MIFGDYIVYADESGDHSLVSINPQNPVFVLALCIMGKAAYRDIIVPSVQKIKFDFWGHDAIILHGHDIRKRLGDFNILLNSEIRAEFLQEINRLISDLPVTVIAAAIDKSRLAMSCDTPANPYATALSFCANSLNEWLEQNGQSGKLTHILVEQRGRTEDRQLESEFELITQRHRHKGSTASLAMRFMDKKHNSTGLQLADLVAHPIARFVINPVQANRAFDLIEPKLRRNREGPFQGGGLKIFP